MISVERREYEALWEVVHAADHNDTRRSPLARRRGARRLKGAVGVVYEICLNEYQRGG